jgi:IS5 family transposase
MRQVVPWKRIARLLKPYYYANTTGRPAYDLVLMIKIHCLQQWYNLGDLGVEEAIHDRFSFQKFLDIDVIQDTVPDETTILNFRHLIEEKQLATQIFQLINEHLSEKGLMLKAGTILDATIIQSPSSTKNKEGKRDPEMSSTRKNGQWYFGMKAHIGVDMNRGLVHRVEVTNAKTADIDVMNRLLHGEEKAVFGDKGYTKREEKKKAREKGIFWGIADRASLKRKPAKNPEAFRGSLTRRQEKRNKLFSAVRAKVEHPFRIIKDLWGHRKTRYKGLYKNTVQMLMLFGLSNLYLSRKAILQGA